VVEVPDVVLLPVDVDDVDVVVVDDDFVEGASATAPMTIMTTTITTAITTVVETPRLVRILVDDLAFHIKVDLVLF
jgi:hypothetical protein